VSENYYRLERPSIECLVDIAISCGWMTIDEERMRNLERKLETHIAKPRSDTMVAAGSNWRCRHPGIIALSSRSGYRNYDGDYLMKSPQFVGSPSRRSWALVVTLALCAGRQAQADDNIAWVDWHTKTANGVIGSILLGEEQVEVSFSGPTFHVFTDRFSEPLWGQANTLATTYLSANVKNPPPNSDSIVIAGGPENLKLTFSTPFKPFLAIASLGLTNSERSVLLLTSMDFEQDFDILSNGPNFYAGGRFNDFEKRTEASTIRLLGRESSGVIAMRGALDEVNWKSPLREEVDGTLVGTYMFTVGASCNGYDIGPNPMTVASAVPKGCTALNKDPAFQQQATLDVRGTLTNRGGWTQGDAVTVADNATLSNNGVYIVGEQKTLTIDGTLRNQGQLDVRGTVHLRAGAGADNIGAVVLKGDNTFPQGGRLQIDAESTFTSSGSLTGEERSQLLVGGILHSGGTLEVLGSMETLASGVVDLDGQGTIKGTLLNRGTFRVGATGHLLFDKFIEFVGAPPLLDNRGVIEVDEGGSLQIATVGDPGGVFLPTTVRNKPGGTFVIHGLLQADGYLDNAGTINLGATGELVGNYTQEATGVLNAAGQVRAEAHDRMNLGGVSHITGSLLIEADGAVAVTAGGKLDVNKFDNAGEFTNAGSVVLNGGADQDSELDYSNSGKLVNDEQFRIANHAFLHNDGEITNNDRFIVDGTLFTDTFMQGSRGELVNNGTIYSSPTSGPLVGLIIFGGRISGNGTFDTVGVTFGEFEFELESPPIEPIPSPAIAPGESPGTLTFTGNLTLSGNTTITMEFTENDGGDRLVVGGQLKANGATMKLVFLGDSTPGLDQVFDFFETPGGMPADLVIESPAALRLDTFDRGVSAAGRSTYGASFASYESFLLEEAEFVQGFDILINNSFGQRFVENSIVRPNAFVRNFGTIGVRNLASARLEVGTFINEAGAELLNSAVMSVSSLTNRGTVKIRNGAQLLIAGSATNEGGLVDIRGEVNVAGGQVYRQTLESALTHVDGVLSAQRVEVLGGTLTGSGRIAADVVLGAGSLLAPGDSPGTLTIEGNLVAQQDSQILIDIASEENFDRVIVSGEATLNGLLRFRLLDGYVPALGQGWQWLEAGSTSFMSALFWLVEAADPNGDYYVLADANGTYDPLRILPDSTQFEFAGDRLILTAAAPVPLPTASWLFLSAIALLRLHRAKRPGYLMSCSKAPTKR